MSIVISEVSHCHPVLCRRLSKVGEGLLDSQQVVGSVAALSRGFMPHSEVGLGLNKVGLKGCPGFVVLVPSGPAVFLVLACLGHQSVCNAD